MVDSFTVRRIMVSVFLTIFFLAGCTSKFVPPEFVSQVNRSVFFEELVQNPDQLKGEWIVLGGIIINSKNLKEGTEIEILQKPLSQTDEPKNVDDSGGRFLALYNGYLETSVYKKERRVTVLGEVIGGEKRNIGETSYIYPVISLKKLRLWPEMEEVPYPYYPYRYDPYYYPHWWYGGHYRYPYYPYWW